MLQDFEGVQLVAHLHHTAAERHGDAYPVEIERMCRADPPQLVGAAKSCVTPGFGQHDAELLAAVAGEALLAADPRAQQSREFAQDEVARKMAVGIVDRLEMVDVQQEE